MVDISDRLKQVTDRATWAERGASFMTKAKATKAIWFPPAPAAEGKKVATKAATTAKKKTGAAAKKSSTSAKNGTARAKKATSGTKKATSGAKKAAASR